MAFDDVPEWAYRAAFDRLIEQEMLKSPSELRMPLEGKIAAADGPVIKAGDKLTIVVRDSLDSPPRRVEIPLGERRYVSLRGIYEQATQAQRCGECRGRGTIQLFTSVVTCTACGGTGRR